MIFFKNGIQGREKAKNVKGVFFTDKMGVKTFVLMNAMIFAF